MRFVNAVLQLLVYCPLWNRSEVLTDRCGQWDGQKMAVSRYCLLVRVTVRQFGSWTNSFMTRRHP